MEMDGYVSSLNRVSPGEYKQDILRETRYLGVSVGLSKTATLPGSEYKDCAQMYE